MTISEEKYYYIFKLQLCFQVKMRYTNAIAEVFVGKTGAEDQVYEAKRISSCIDKRYNGDGRVEAPILKTQRTGRHWQHTKGFCSAGLEACTSAFSQRNCQEQKKANSFLHKSFKNIKKETISNSIYEGSIICILKIRKIKFRKRKL